MNKKPVDFYFLTIRGAQRHKNVNGYIAPLWDHLREACKKTHDQSMVETQWTITEVVLWSVDQCHFFGAWWFCLSEGALIWGEEGNQRLMGGHATQSGESDCKWCPSCIVEDEQGPSQILHCNWLLIAPEVERDILLCADVCTSWARCTSLTLDELTSEGSEIEESPQWAECLASALHKACKTPLGWSRWELCALPGASAGICT